MNFSFLFDEKIIIIYIICMAFDGSVVAAITDELNKATRGGKIVKIAQPEKDELLLTIKNNGETLRLLICVNPSLPIVYFTDTNIPSPATAPSFCMALRKHLSSGNIIEVSQPGLERIINIDISHYNELGDLCKKTLVIELMGKHSNIILLEGNKIIDSIKHISANISSVREVLPGREYFVPFSDKKKNPLTVTREEFMKLAFSENLPMSKALYTFFSGLSPDISEEIIYRAGKDSQVSATAFTDPEKDDIYNSFNEVMEIIRAKAFAPNIILENGVPVSYGMFEYKIFSGLDTEHYTTPSLLLRSYYEKKKIHTSMRQKTRDLRQVLNGLLAKANKKYDLQLKQLKDTEKKDRFRLYGELLTAYGYNVKPGEKTMTATDYNTGEDIDIPLDPTLTAIENGKKYFDKYSKLKRTAAALTDIAVQTKLEIEHLESISAALDMAESESDLSEIRKEMTDFGFLKKRSVDTKKKKTGLLKSPPLHYISADGFDIYVGKNNYQNDNVTFGIASGEDWWFHAKGIPGSHVVVKTGGRELPDETFMEAARLAAYYSKANRPGVSTGSSNVEIDYVQRKFLKKTPGGKPGFVIYHTNYSMSAPADITGIRQIIE